MLLDVLLVEDDPAKKTRLLEFLNKGKGALFGRVDTAICANDALAHARERQYDLLLVDVVIPSVLGGTTSEDNSVGLLSQLDEGIGAFRPHFSVALSAATQLSPSAKDFFIGRPWQILPYSDSNDDCLGAIEKIANYIVQRRSSGTPERKCDIFVITALMEPEFTALEKRDFQWTPLEPLDESQFIRFGKLEIGGRERTIAAAFASRMGAVASAILVSKVLLLLKPRLLVLSGICAGIDGKADIGDVISADISWDWQSGKYVDKNGLENFEIAPDQIGIDEQVRAQITLLRRDKAFWSSLGEFAAKIPVRAPKLVVGPLATGSAVLADARVADRIKSTQHRNLSGLDMETYGAYAAARSCDLELRYIALKSVCDMGDTNKDDKYQEYAADISARTVFHFLKNYAEPLLT